MKQLAFAAAATLALALPAAALEAPRKIVDYDIKVSLDPETKLVEGSESHAFAEAALAPRTECQRFRRALRRFAPCARPPPASAARP